ncbi:MAG: 50S ribosomal protein L25 [Verrucomicrobia bacterium]|nr:50S ribosomal protein L25 [Verrucomicrobiota bacterium]MDA1065367.1 50S ribosomal protein L25 [Verrucomicrobiota bacterium]
MSDLNISVDPRKEVGRGSNRRLRSSGKIPGVIYSKGESRAVSFDSKEFEKLRKSLIGRTPLVTLTEGKKEVLALIQEIQAHPIKDFFFNVDFLEVTRGEEMTAHAALHVVGEPDGVKNEGGNLEVHLHEIEVTAIPSNIPDFIEVDVSALKAGDALHVADLPKIEGVTYHLHEDTVIVSVSGARVEEVVEPVEEPMDPEAEDSEEAPGEEENA